MRIFDFLISLFEAAAPRPRRFWLFYAGPENYLCSIGLRDLTGEVFWSCEQKTRTGDLILLYRKSINQRAAKGLAAEFHMPLNVAKQLKGSKVGKDFPSIWMATTDAKRMRDWGWRHGCTVKEVQRIDPPLLLDDLKADKRLLKWEGLRSNFQATGRSALKIPQDSWEVIMSLISGPER